MKPRAVILENVPQILQQADELIAALTTCKAYVFKVLTFQTADYGIPHHRLRVYIMLRTNAVVHGTHRALSNIARVMKECGQPTPCSWPMWFKKIGLPVSPVTTDSPVATDSSKFVLAKPCVHCSAHKLCREHVCKCKQCSAARATKKKRCAWRANVKTFLKTSEGCKEVLGRVADDQEESSSQNAAFLLGSGFTFRSASARTHCHKL
jgi:site-specific DNA-cytosine methylase